MIKNLNIIINFVKVVIQICNNMLGSLIIVLIKWGFNSKFQNSYIVKINEKSVTIHSSEMYQKFP